MLLLTEALERLITLLQKNNFFLASSMQPGLSYMDIEEIVKELPIRLPKEVYELYQWRNGSRDPAGWYLPLQDAVALYLKKIENYDPSWMPEFRGPNWFAIFSQAEPPEIGYVVIYEDQENCPVIFKDCKGGDNYTTVQYANLTSMILTILKCNETGAYDVDDKGYLIYGNDKINQIWREYNFGIVEAAMVKLEDNLSLQSLTELVDILRQFKDLRAVEPLIQALQVSISEITDPDENSGIRALAARILGELGDTRALEPLMHALQDEDWMTRYWATIALGQLGDKRAVEPLSNALQDSEEKVRSMADWALKQLTNEYNPYSIYNATSYKNFNKLPPHQSSVEGSLSKSNLESNSVIIQGIDSTEVNQGEKDRFTDLLAHTNSEIKRIGWSVETCRNALMEMTGGKEGKRSRFLCTESELENFLAYLQSQPTPEIPLSPDQPKNKDSEHP